MIAVLNGGLRNRSVVLRGQKCLTILIALTAAEPALTGSVRVRIHYVALTTLSTPI